LSHACRALSARGPVSFLEACQLYWFATLFRIGTATIGRMDQHLYNYYKNDRDNMHMSLTAARNLVSELLFRFEKRGNTKGDTLQNITLSGKDAMGRDQTNELTSMILELFLKQKYLEPKINIRVHEGSPDSLLDLAAQLQLKGTGICTLFNDESIVDGLLQHGRPPQLAFDYCNDGCSEIILDGYGETVFRYVDCVKAVEHTLFNGEENVPSGKKLQYYSATEDYINVAPPVPEGIKTGDFLQMNSFEEFYEAYLAQLKHQVDVVLKEPYSADEYPMRLFTAATMPDVIEKGIEPHLNSSCYHSYGLFIGSLGTASNSIAAVKYLVFDKQAVTRKALLEGLRKDFDNEPVLLALCKGAPKYGNDNDYVDEIAVDTAKQFASWVREYSDRTGKPILSGLYNHLFQYTAYSVGATPDGRRFGDPVGEHLSPTPGTAEKGPTGIINSITKINTKEHIFGSTLHLNIPAVSLKGTKKPADLLKYLDKVFCQKGGCVLNVNVLDSDKLMDAQRHPEKYKDLIVRVWGFSYYFTLLSKEMQDHVIMRSKNVWTA
ncbi:MAG: hypothetical protein NTV01_07085, partial [Bacteroidia bacterium]|nr:hypothetical protein [Bacteroidia bacterium]